MKTCRFYWKQAERGNSTQFILFLHQLHQAFPNKKLLLILDNGPIHRSKKVQSFISRHDWIELFFLPPYSPEYNPIERFWLWLKRNVYGAKSFTKIEQLIAKIRKLVWHYREGKTISKINFQFQAYENLL